MEDISEAKRDGFVLLKSNHIAYYNDNTCHLTCHRGTLFPPISASIADGRRRVAEVKVPLPLPPLRHVLLLSCHVVVTPEIPMSCHTAMHNFQKNGGFLVFCLGDKRWLGQVVYHVILDVSEQGRSDRGCRVLKAWAESPEHDVFSTFLGKRAGSKTGIEHF